MNPPVLSNEQREYARRVAADARRERADVRASLREGRVSVIQVLESTTEAHQRMRVRDVVRSLPGIGPVRCEEILESAGIASIKRVGGLTEHQRGRLLQQLADRAQGTTR
jgi:hypothetical protein